jgi:hypothetical protein
MEQRDAVFDQSSSKDYYALVKTGTSDIDDR